MRKFLQFDSVIIFEDKICAIAKHGSKSTDLTFYLAGNNTIDISFPSVDVRDEQYNRILTAFIKNNYGYGRF